MTEAYPLHWPQGKPRTRNTERSRFKVPGFCRVRDALMSELGRLGARHVVLSTNIPLKGDGMPYASFKALADVGVAVYFQYNKKPMCFAYDRWWSVEENMQAVHHTIEALRGIARWGTGDMLQAAFEGFTALPQPKSWPEILKVPRDALIDTIETHYKILARKHHPDMPGGSEAAMAEINAAIAAARKEKGIS